MMNRIAALLTAIATAACASRAKGPVAGAPEAARRHYPVTVVEAHAALIKVLTATYGGVASDDGRHVIAPATCRDKDGDACAHFPPSSGGSSFGASSPTNLADHPSSSGATVGHYWFQVTAGIVGDDGDVQIQLGGRAQDFDKHVVVVGTSGSPAWMPHEVDEMRIAVDRELAAQK